MMDLQALIFDVDGTLADTEEAHRQSFNRAFEAHGLDWHWTRPRYAELLGVSGGRERIRLHLDSLALDANRKAALAARIDDIHRTKVEAYRALVESGGVPLRIGTRRLIEEALAEGLKLAVATTGTAAGVEALLERALGKETVRGFAAIAAGDVVGRRKPAPDVYHYVLQRLDVAPGACVAFEDSANGVRAARAAGIPVVATRSLYTAEDDLDGALAIFPDLAEVSLAELRRLHAGAAAHGGRPRTGDQPR